MQLTIDLGGGFLEALLFKQVQRGLGARPELRIGDVGVGVVGWLVEIADGIGHRG